MTKAYSHDPARRVLIPAVSTSFYLRSPHGVPLTALDKIKFFLIKTPCILYWIGAAAFFVGSILFYPIFNIENDLIGLGDSFGSIFFFFGSLGFLMGSWIEVYHAKQTHLTAFGLLDRYAPLVSSLLNVIGSIFFVIGSVFFFPHFYLQYPSKGCWLFIIGCFLFSFSLLVDIIRYSSSELKTSFHWCDLLSLWFLATALNFGGNILFISGCYFYLPMFLLIDDIVMAQNNLIFATNQFVIGSIFFGLAPPIQIYGIHEDMTTTKSSFLQLP